METSLMPSWGRLEFPEIFCWHGHVYIEEMLCRMVSSQNEQEDGVKKDDLTTSGPSVRYYSGQISSQPHTTDFPQMVVNWKGNGTPYFRKIQVGEIL